MRRRGKEETVYLCDNDIIAPNIVTGMLPKNPDNLHYHDFTFEKELFIQFRRLSKEGQQIALHQIAALADVEYEDELDEKEV